MGSWALGKSEFCAGFSEQSPVRIQSYGGYFGPVTVHRTLMECGPLANLPLRTIK